MEDHGHCSILSQYYLDTLRAGGFGGWAAVETSPDKREGITGHHAVRSRNSGGRWREATHSDARTAQSSVGTSGSKSAYHRTKEHPPRSPPTTNLQPCNTRACADISTSAEFSSFAQKNVSMQRNELSLRALVATKYSKLRRLTFSSD